MKQYMVVILLTLLLDLEKAEKYKIAIFLTRLLKMNIEPSKILNIQKRSNLPKVEEKKIRTHLKTSNIISNPITTWIATLNILKLRDKSKILFNLIQSSNILYLK